MSYQYDVFFSYKRDAESDWWHRTTMQKLRHWLKQELHELDVRIFFDTQEIRTGQLWPDKIRRALGSSKVIVCVWSPLYFRSQWCVSEWKTFAERERLCGRELVIPARYHDGDHFPEEARAKQSLDLSHYTSTLPGFWETALADEFERECLKRLASDIAAAIRMAPPFDPAFPLVQVSAGELPPLPPIGRPGND